MASLNTVTLNSTNSTNPVLHGKLKVSYIGLNIQSCIVIGLNIIELHLIRLRWTSKKITNFEIILMNLALADLLAGVGMLAASLFGMLSGTSRHKYELLAIIVVVLILGVVSSIFYVLLIGIERLLAIKLPFKMREWQSERGTMAKFMIFTWVLNLSFTVIGGTLDEVFRKKGEQQTLFGSRTVTYFMSAYIIIATAAILCLYSWISYLVLLRHEKFDRSLKNADKMSKVKLFTKAIRREKATLVICVLVMVSFVSCNLPIAIRYLVGAKEGNPEVFLVMANSSLNPLIYFFKGYLEKEYANRKAATSSSSGQGVELRTPNLVRKTTSETKLDVTRKESYGALENGTRHEEHGKTESNEEVELDDFGGTDEAYVDRE